MSVRKAGLSTANSRLSFAAYEMGDDKHITKAGLDAEVKKVEANTNMGKEGAAALKVAYAQAKATVGGLPTGNDIRAEVTKATNAMFRESALGRVNDGYIDGRELRALDNPLADALHSYMDTNRSFDFWNKPKMNVSVKATTAKIASAVETLRPVVDAATELLKKDPAKYDDLLVNALREAANAAGLSTKGRVALLTACNGVTSRGDGSAGPDGAEVIAALERAQTKLVKADGAKIVDLANPDAKPKSKKDGVITGEEVDRTPALTGKTAVTLLEYASSL